MENHKPLKVTLCVLSCIVIILVIGNIVLFVQGSEEAQQTSLQTATQTEETSTPRLLPIEEPEISEEDINNESLIMKYTESYNESFQSLLNASNIDIESINKLLGSNIEKALSYNKTDYAIMFINTYYDGLASKNLFSEALKELITLDYSPYSEPAQYRLYAKIIESAEKTGDAETLAKYQALQKTVEEAYWADYHKTEEAVLHHKDEEMERIKELNKEMQEGTE